MERQEPEAWDSSKIVGSGFRGSGFMVPKGCRQLSTPSESKDYEGAWNFGF